MLRRLTTIVLSTLFVLAFACGSASAASGGSGVPVFKCDSLTARATGESNYQFTLHYTAQNGAAVAGYMYDFGDGVMVNAPANTVAVDHEYSLGGKYIATVSVIVQVHLERFNTTITVIEREACSVRVDVQTFPSPAA